MTEHQKSFENQSSKDTSSPSISERKKRKRSLSSIDDSIASDEQSVNHGKNPALLVDEHTKHQTPKVMTGVRLPGLVYPTSLYKNDQAITTLDSEDDVLKSALEHSQTSFGDEAFFALNIEDFAIYRSHSARKHQQRGLEERPSANELISLHDVEGRGTTHWFLDAVVCQGQEKKYVQRVPCNVFSIGGFEDTELHTTNSSIWVQSKAGQKLDMWYSLGRPASQYKRFHQPFLWLADLAKHLVDFLNMHDKVSLKHFRKDFQTWLQGVHGADEGFRQWQKAYNDTDFRRIVTAHAAFLYNQAALLGREYTSHPLWKEIDPFTMDAVPRQTEEVMMYEPIAGPDCPKLSKPVSRPKTVVTPFVYDCFKHLPWAKFLDVQSPSGIRHQHPSTNAAKPLLQPQNVESDKASQQCVRIGDVVSVASDIQTSWSSKESLWYGFVQDIKQETNQLSLLWLYQPSDTACQNMRYPHSNELFLSDHCNCGDKPIYACEVVSKPRVAFFGRTDTPNADFFVRQKYNAADSAWVTLDRSDFECVCNSPKKTEIYATGATVLVRIAHSEHDIVLEAVELLEPSSLDQVRVRRLLSRRNYYGDSEADSNELVYTSKIETLSRSSICRICHVRFYTTAEKHTIPVPYCRNGMADFYYIITQDYAEAAKPCLIPLVKPWPTSLRQGFDPYLPSPHPIMRGLDIFCGGGCLGRGLEEGGAVKMVSAVDYFKQAIHTYSANVNEDHDTKLFYGSVNDYLSKAMAGKQGKGRLIAQSGEVDVIAAGSPCPGFSSINFNKASDESLINASMVASVVSFVDFYRPRYALLENVLGMANCGTKDKDQNVFAQILCALVGLGYQIRPFILDAWNFGSPQSRTRIFISIAAPGLTPLLEPPQSHSHPKGTTDRALGKTANGLPVGERCWGPTPLKYVTIREATKDLPLSDDGKVDCIPFPDHRLTISVSPINQTLICNVPKHPHGMSFIKAVKLGWQSDTQLKAWNWTSLRSSENSRAWKRVYPHGLMPTVTTKCTPQDGISGQWVHWEADRPMTVMEARRAQGYPDHEVIVGTPAMQWKIIGNSVARPVALALGFALRTAWLANEARVPEISAASTNKAAVFEPFEDNQIRTDEFMASSEPDESNTGDTATPMSSSSETVTRETTTSDITGQTKTDLIVLV
ncbi:MAG: hypothetical protein Q9195_000316 [Heterodermia aff. obscurata]